ncbi:hypothetical protein AB1Y20_000590 [Prymnesium parvum]|uniref:DUF1995 domain-containing protein n=1 Tax=Prymnesium parvum TaxID=97485 RepID=A0AB34K5A6_PRYPA
MLLLLAASLSPSLLLLAPLGRAGRVGFAPRVAAPVCAADDGRSPDSSSAMVDGEIAIVSMPPESFKQLVEQAAEATAAAISDGALQMEVEFPPLPTSKLDDSSISAYDILEANLRLVLEYHKRLLPLLPSVQNVALTLPDLPERKRAVELLGDDEPWPGLKAWSLVGGDANPGPFDWVSSVLKQGVPEPELAEWADMYIELPTLNLLRQREPTKPVIYFNLKLDVLRGDLGLPGFPPRSTHHEFLSFIKPVYYLRPRSYSLSLSRPPFLIAYQGVLFRKYPEGYQTLLDRGKQKYRRVLVNKDRPALGLFKAQLTSALKLEDDAADSAISQAGYKQSTWWEDDVNKEDVSQDWRK